MRIGTEDKTKFRLMLALLTIAALLLTYTFFRPDRSSIASNGPSAKKATVHQEVPSTIDLHRDALAAVPQNTDELGSKNIFRMQETEVSRKNFSHVNPPPPPPPVDLQPSIPLKFYGFARKQADPDWIFLQDNQDIFVTRLGDTVDRRYKVIELRKNGALIEDVLRNERQLVPFNER